MFTSSRQGRPLTRRPAMGGLPAEFFSPRPRALAPVPSFVPRKTHGGLPGRPLGVLRRPAPISGARRFAAFLAPLRKPNGSSTPSARSADPRAVLAYLARYTHRVAIANSRLIALPLNGAVTFKWKDYRIKGQRSAKERSTLSTDEFIRRFLIHVLPNGFHRIRHYVGRSCCYRPPPTRTLASILSRPGRCNEIRELGDGSYR